MCLRDTGCGRCVDWMEKKKEALSLWFCTTGFYSTVILPHASSTGLFTVEPESCMERGGGGHCLVKSSSCCAVAFFSFFFFIFSCVGLCAGLRRCGFDWLWYTIWAG